MKLTSMQFDGDGGYDTPMNAGATAAAASPAYQDGDDRIARNSAAAGRAAAAAKAVEGDRGTYWANNATNSTPAAKTKAPKAIDKSNWDKGTKVPQSTVDAVKDAGRGNMGAVPQRIVKNDAIGLSAPGYVGSQLQYNAPVSKEYKEATKRVYPNEVKTPRSPSFNESSPNAKPYPKIAAPKTNINKVKELRNKEISDANNKGTALNDRVAYTIINGLKGGASAYGAGTQKYSQIPGTQTKTQKAQAERKAERSAAVKSAAESKPAEKIKVSQATVDAVKKAGKAKATGAANTKGSSAEYREAVKRIYPTSKKK
jgi:hypothetical protein